MKEFLMTLKNEILKIVKSSRDDWHLINVKNYFGKKIVKFDGVVI